MLYLEKIWKFYKYNFPYRIVLPGTSEEMQEVKYLNLFERRFLKLVPWRKLQFSNKHRKLDMFSERKSIFGSSYLQHAAYLHSANVQPWQHMKRFIFILRDCAFNLFRSQFQYIDVMRRYARFGTICSNNPYERFSHFLNCANSIKSRKAFLTSFWRFYRLLTLNIFHTFF